LEKSGTFDVTGRILWDTGTEIFKARKPLNIPGKQEAMRAKPVK
jgi:hypothetical protein